VSLGCPKPIALQALVWVVFARRREADAVQSNEHLHLAVQFFLQIAVILLFCRLVGALAARLGQPQVVAEMLAGFYWVHLSLGWFAGGTALAVSVGQDATVRDTQSYLFPASQLGWRFTCSQSGWSSASISCGSVSRVQSQFPSQAWSLRSCSASG